MAEQAPDGAAPRVAGLILTGEHVGQLRRVLAESFAEQTRLQIALLATIDGRVVAQEARVGLDAVKLAALGSTMMSMAAAAVREIGGKTPDECLLTHAGGILCIGRTGPLGRLVLCLAAGADLNMGLLVSGWRRTASAIAAAVQ